MYAIFLTLYILVAIALIVLVLIQHGKGADIGAAFGSGASNTVFGSQGSGGFLFKLTGGLAAAFFAIALILGYMVNSQYHQQIAEPVLSKALLPVKKQTIPLPDADNALNSTKDVAPAVSNSGETTNTPRS